MILSPGLGYRLHASGRFVPKVLVGGSVLKSPGADETPAAFARSISTAIGPEPSSGKRPSKPIEVLITETTTVPTSQRIPVTNSPGVSKAAGSIPASGTISATIAAHAVPALPSPS